jgi:hypothetical protein
MFFTSQNLSDEEIRKLTDLIPNNTRRKSQAGSLGDQAMEPAETDARNHTKSSTPKEAITYRSD